MDVGAQAAVSYVVTLIHGTFARGAPWTQENSRLRKDLLRYLGSVTFRTFEWTGANSHNARIAAGSQLGEHILSIKTEFPEARHFLIAHSHGGNVIFYSLRDLEAKNAICGTVTMGTPFIKCDLRPDQTVVGVVRYLAAALGFLASYILLAIGYENFVPDFISQSKHEMLMATATLLAFAVWKLIHEPVRRWFSLAGNRALARLTPSSTQTPCLVIHTPYDEAGLLLNTIRRVAIAPFHFSNGLLGVLPTLLGTAAILLGLGEFVESIMELDEPVFDTRFIMAIGATLTFAVLIGILFGMAAIPPIVRGHPLAYGWERILDNLTVDLGTIVHPRKEKHPLDHSFRFSSNARWGELRHSRMYQDPIVIEHISQWMYRLASAKDDNVYSAQIVREEPTKDSKGGTWPRRVLLGIVVFALIALWAVRFLDAAENVYGDPIWRTQLRKSTEQLVYSEKLADVFSAVSSTQSWILPIQVPNNGKCRISGSYVSEKYSLILNVESGSRIDDLLDGKAKSSSFEIQSTGMRFTTEGGRRRSFDILVAPGKRQLRLWMFDYSNVKSTNFYLKAYLFCWSGDTAFVSKSWSEQIATLDLSPLGLPYPLW